MKISGLFKRIMKDEEGNVEITFSINNLFYIEHIKELVKDLKYSIEIKKLKSKRSEEQNRYMWALLTEISMIVDGTKANKMDYYIECLERANAKYSYIWLEEGAEDALKNFRANKRLNYLEVNNRKGYEYQVYLGSSQFNTKEMSVLINHILDLAAEVGVDNLYYYNEVLK